MTYGLQVTNPDGVLVIDSEATYYRFHSQPSYMTAGSKDLIELYPYVFRVNTGTDVAPLVVVRPFSDRITEFSSTSYVGGGVWDINVFCTSNVGATEDRRSSAVAVPTIYVFVPMSSAGTGYGMQLRNSAGQVTFDTNYKPLWPRSMATYPTYSYIHDPNGGSEPWLTTWNGDTQPVSGYSILGVLGNTNGYSSTDSIAETGEPADYWSYGWSYNGSLLMRERYWAGTQRSYHTFNMTTDHFGWQLRATSAIVLDLATY